MAGKAASQNRRNDGKIDTSNGFPPFDLINAFVSHRMEGMTFFATLARVLSLLAFSRCPPPLPPAMCFLTIGGGHSRESNQASLEKNVLFYQQLLKEQNVPAAQQSIYFASGVASNKDVQASTPTRSPKPIA